MQDEHHHGQMGSRGVTRPMSEMHMQHGGKPDDGESRHGDDRHEQQAKGEHGEGGHGTSHDDRLQMLRMHHKQTLWIYWTLPLLGCWLLVAPFNFGYLNAELWVDPSGGRGPWFANEPLRELRAWLMAISDIVCGLLLLFFGWRSLTPNRPKSLWACCFVGVWLTFAPVLFWAPTAASYANDSLVGILVMALTILIPGMPNMFMYMQHGPATPPGWSYNPSSWPQRWIMIAAGFAGFIVSGYLGMFQLGYITYVWDPFFGFVNGTKQVLNSAMSHSWPISDGGLGGVSYTFEFLMGYMGSPARWRTMPWMVAFFGVLVIPMGLTHIILVISQPVVVHAWWTMCLLTIAFDMRWAFHSMKSGPLIRSRSSSSWHCRIPVSETNDSKFYSYRIRGPETEMAIRQHAFDGDKLLIQWQPGQLAPNCSQAAYQCRNRWKLRHVQTCIAYLATSACSQQFGGRMTGEIKKDLQATHDLGVARVWLQLDISAPH